jgi:hypothetical protein
MKGEERSAVAEIDGETPSKKSEVFTVGAMIGVARSTCQSLVSGVSELKKVTRWMASPTVATSLEGHWMIRKI